MRILLTQTDESHMLTVNELISKLAESGVSAERKTVYDDIENPRRSVFKAARRLIPKNSFPA